MVWVEMVMAEVKQLNGGAFVVGGMGVIRLEAARNKSSCVAGFGNGRVVVRVRLGGRRAEIIRTGCRAWKRRGEVLYASARIGSRERRPAGVEVENSVQHSRDLVVDKVPWISAPKRSANSAARTNLKTRRSSRTAYKAGSSHKSATEKAFRNIERELTGTFKHPESCASLLNRLLDLMDQPGYDLFAAARTMTLLARFARFSHHHAITVRADLTAHSQFISRWRFIVLRELPKANDVALATILRALGSLRVSPGLDFLAMWSAAATVQIASNEFSINSLVGSLWGFAKLGERPSAAFLAAWHQAFAMEVFHANCEELVAALWAFAELGIAELPLVSQNAWHAGFTIERKLFTTRQLLTLLSSFARLNVDPPDSLYEEIAARFRRDQNVSSLSDARLCSVVDILALLRASVSNHDGFTNVMNAWSGAFCRREMSGVLLHRVILSLDRAGASPDEEMLRVWLDQLKTRASELSQEQLSECMWSYANFGRMPSAAFTAPSRASPFS